MRTRSTWIKITKAEARTTTETKSIANKQIRKKSNNEAWKQRSGKGNTMNRQPIQSIKLG